MLHNNLKPSLNLPMVLLLICFYLQGNAQIEPNKNSQLERYNQLIEKYHEEGSQSLELEYLNKAAFIYWENQNYDKATEYFNRSIKINENLGNKNGVKSTYYYLGMVSSDQEKYVEAIQYFEKGIAISRDLKRKSSILSGLINKAQAEQRAGRNTEALSSAEEALLIAKELNELRYMRTCNGILAEIHQLLGNTEKSMEYFNQFSMLDKHLKKEEITAIKEQSKNEVEVAKQEKAKTEEELVRQTDKLKETEDSLAVVERLTREQHMQLELKEAQIREKEAQLRLVRIIRNVFIWGFIALLLVAIVIFLFFKQVKKQKMLIEEQKDILDRQHKKISASIDYAQNIQQAVLPLKSVMEEYFDVSIIYHPKDIVSGDFYWFTETPDKAFMAVVDCTGHGVPGAFMSMIGNTLLNEIILEKKVTMPAAILTELDKEVRAALKQDTTDNTDGMDVCLISLTKDNSHCLHFAGAKRPLYYFKVSENKWEEIKGDRRGIGGRSKKQDERFTDHELCLESGDRIFLSSDGIVDQNNKERKRFGTKKIKEILQENAALEVEEQVGELERALLAYMNQTEQRDDITFIGAKIKDYA